MIEAVEPETYTFRGLFSMLGKVTGRRRPVLPVPPWGAYAAAGIMGMLHRDVMLTRDEILGLMEDRPALKAFRLPVPSGFPQGRKSMPRIWEKLMLVKCPGGIVDDEINDLKTA